MLFFFPDLVPITAEENYNYVLPQPSNLSDPAFEKFKFIPKDNSFGVINNQQTDLENKDQTINTLISDLAKLKIKNKDFAKENQEKEKRILALTNTITELLATDTVAQLKADRYYLKQQHNRDKRTIESLRRRSAKGQCTQLR